MSQSQIADQLHLSGETSLRAPLAGASLLVARTIWVILAIANTLNLPVRWVGVGEQVDDLLPFDAEDFIDSLLEL